MPRVEDIEGRMQAFRELCRRRGLRITPQHTEVLREVARTDEHPDADVILHRVRKRLPNISLDTVYRILYRLEDEGLISRVQVSGDRLRFDGNCDRHHHFTCSECGTIRDFTSADVDRVRVPRQVRSWGEIESRQLLIRGVCRECLRKRRRPKAR